MSGTKAKPWELKTAPGTASFEAWREPDADPPALVVQSARRSSAIRRCLDDLVAMLDKHDDWMLLAKNNRVRAKK